jgi:ribonuclease BN (tRNA processing enzyme)
MSTMKNRLSSMPLLRCVLFCITVLIFLSPIALAQVPWQATSAPATLKIDEDKSEWTTTQEERQYAALDGTQVIEIRKTTTKRIEWEVVFAEVETRKNEKKAAFTTDTRTNEKLYSGGKAV